MRREKASRTDRFADCDRLRHPSPNRGTRAHVLLVQLRDGSTRVWQVDRALNYSSHLMRLTELDLFSLPAPPNLLHPKLLRHPRCFGQSSGASPRAPGGPDDRRLARIYPYSCRSRRRRICQQVLGLGFWSSWHWFLLQRRGGQSDLRAHVPPPHASRIIGRSNSEGGGSRTRTAAYGGNKS